MAPLYNMERKRHVPGLWIVCAFVLLAGHASLFANHTVDDAYISARYAENWAGGHGLVFNPDERVEGFSNLLLVAVEALMIGLNIDPILSAKAFGLLASLSVIALLALLCRPVATPAGIMAGCIIFAASPAVALWSVAGLEGTLQAFWLLLWIGVLLRLSAAGSIGAARFLAWQTSRLWQWGVGLGVTLPVLLSALTRPEGVMFLAANVFILASFPRTRRIAISAAIVSIAAYGSLLIWRHAYYGAWLPNTFAAKVVRGLSPGAPSGLHSGLVYLVTFLVRGGGAGVVALTLPAFIDRQSRKLAWMISIPIALQLLFTLAVGGDWMIGHRFIVPVIPVMCLLAALGISQRGVWQRWNRQHRWPILQTVLVTAVLTLQFADAVQLNHDAKEYSEGVRRAHVQLGLRLAHEAQPGSSVAVIDAGAIPYFSKLRAVDMLGLTSREVASSPDPSFAALVVLRSLPDYVVITNQAHHAGWDMNALAPLSVPERSLLASPIFYQYYQRVSDPFQYVFAYYELILMKRTSGLARQ